MDAQLSEVSDLTEKFLKLKKQIEAIEEEMIAPLSKEVQQVQGKLLSLLESNNLKKFSSPAGSVNVVVEKTVAMPKGDDKFDFIDYMREIGEWDAMASIHHPTLNSWFKEKVKDNPLFVAPGLGLPRENKYLKRGK